MQENSDLHSTQEILAAASAAISNGEIQKAHEIVAPIINRKNLSTQQKLKLSYELQWIGLPTLAMKVLGKLSAPAEFHLLAPEEFCLQIRAVYMLNFLGATYVARRLLERIEEHLEKNKIDLTGFHFSLNTYKAFIYYESARYSEALPLFEKVVEATKEHNTDAYLNLHYIVCLEAVGKEEQALALARKTLNEIEDENKTLRAMYLQNIGRMETLLGKLQDGQSSLEFAIQLYGHDCRNKDHAYAVLWHGINLAKQGDKTQVKALLDAAWDVLHHPLSQPQAQLNVLYWMEKTGNHPSMAAQITLRTHPCVHSNAFLLGRPLPKDLPYPLHARIKKEAIANINHDAWIIQDSSIAPVSYNELDLNQYSSLLDLYAGVEKTNQEREAFTEIQVRAIIACLGAGPIGIHEFALVDFIYRQEFWDWQSGKERLKKLVQYLRKKGLALTVKNQIHQLDLADVKSKTIIIPMALDFQGHHHFVKGHLKAFTRQQLEDILKTKKTNATLLLKEWSEKGIIREHSKDGPKVIYTFLEGA